MSRRGGGGRGRGGSKSSTATKELLKRSASEAGLDDRHVKVLSDITRPPLFPDFLWKSSGNYWNEEDEVVNSNDNGLGLQQQLQQQPIKSESPSPAVTPRKLSAAMASTNNKQREMNRQFQNLPFYIRPSVLVDIVRYSDRMDRNKGNATPDATVLASIAAASSHGHGIKNKATAAAAAAAVAYKSYFPEELLLGKKPNVRRPNARAAGRSKTQKSTTTTAHAVAMKLEKLDHQEETGKLRTTSITSITSNDDDLILLPVPPLTTSNMRKTSEADEMVLDDGDDDDNGDDDDDDVDNPHDVLEETVEEELGEDYTTNYYASDDDNNNNDDGDGEPTY